MGRSKGKGKRYQDDSAAAVVEDVKEAIVEEEEESSSDDDSSQSSSSSTSSDDDSGDSPTPSDLNNGKRHDASTQSAPSNSKTWDSMDGYEVRQNALKLLNVSPDANETKKGGIDERKSMNSVTYQSYHDSPYSSTGSQSMERPSNFSSMHSSQYTSSVQPTWGDSRYNDANNAADDSLSVYHIASLTFNCMVHCLTEGYRAASTYYSNYAEDSGPSHTGGFRSTSTSYEHVGSYQDNSYSGVSSGQSHYREVMERDSSQPKPPEAAEEGDWGTTVKLPSTYQGKK